MLHKAVAALAVAILISIHPAGAAGKNQKLYCCSPKANHFVQETIRIHRRAAAHPKLQHLSYRSVLNSSFLSRFTILGTFRFTGYTGGDPGQGTSSHTALGTLASYGNAAVDPRVIPLGRYLYIPGYGVARASDTGGAVGGAHIDLCFGIGGPGSVAYLSAIRWSAAHPSGTVYLIPPGLERLFI